MGLIDMVPNNTMLTFIFLLALLPSYPFPAIKTFAPLVLITWLVLFKLVNCEIRVSVTVLLILTLSICGVTVSSLIGAGDLTAIAKEFIRANSLIVFLILIGGVVNINVSKLIKSLWFIIILNFILVFFQFNEFGFTVIYTQANAEMPFFRPAGVMGNPNLTAFFISCLLMLFSFEERFSRRLFAVLLCITTGVFMQSRSGLLLIILSSLYVLSFGRGGKKFIFSVFLLIMSLFLIGVPFLENSIDSSIGDKFSYLMSAFRANEVTDISSVALRVELWSIALKKMTSVIFGGAIYDATLVVDSEYIYAYTHRGVYGFLIYLFIFLFAYFKLEPSVRGRWLFLGLIVMICSVQAETISSVLHSSIIGAMLLIIGACRNKYESRLIHEH